ncbi:helix-turn-helix domain-containing protein [Oscillospiraceae bacterium 21-37]
MSIYEGIMKGLGEALEHAEGKCTLRTVRVSSKEIAPLSAYTPETIKEIRSEQEMTQVTFAKFLGVSPKTVEAWEVGRNQPNGPACRILSMLQQDPELPEKYGFIKTT